MSVTVLVGDCMETLPTLEAGSVQMCLSSPPYFALRSYLPAGHPDKHREIGSEPTPEAFVATMVAVFREVRRVLRDDGILVLNLGDSYAGSGKGPTGSNGIGDQERRQGFTQGNPSNSKPNTARLPALTSGYSTPFRTGAGYVGHQQPAVDGYKPKDLLMIPFRVAMALQSDGWYLRSVIPWVKRNPMPESVTDRPASAVEYLFLLAKSRRYWWDGDAIRQTVSPASDFGRDRPEAAMPSSFGHHRSRLGNGSVGNESGRNYRNSDAFFQSWQGLDLDEYGDPLASIVNPAALAEAHFASFPPKLVEPFVKAGSREGDTVLDPFGGAGTVGLVASRLNRHALLLELHPAYAEIARRRIAADAGPLFGPAVTVAAPTQLSLEAV